jgi:hypothetical protein
MRIAVVSYISFFDNVIQQKIVSVGDGDRWQDALEYAINDGLLGENKSEEIIEWIMSLPDDYDSAREEIFNGGIDICVTFVDISLLMKITQ